MIKLCSKQRKEIDDLENGRHLQLSLIFIKLGDLYCDSEQDRPISSQIFSNMRIENQAAHQIGNCSFSIFSVS